MKYKGMCRIKGDNNQPNRVRVTDGDMIFDDVTEADYNFAMILPPLEELPWCSSDQCG